MLSFPTIAAVTVAGPEGRPVVPYPVEQLVRAAAQAGFRGVGLDWFSLRDAETRGVELTSLTQLVAELGLVWTDLAALGLDADESKDDRISRSMARRCKELAIPVCALVSSVAVSDAVYRRVAACADIFNDSGVRVALEFLPYSGIRTLADARDVCARVGYDRCGILIDTLHLMRSGGTPHDVALLSATEIACVQLADAPAELPADLADESRNARLLPGAGAFDTPGFVAALHNIGYIGTVSVEVLSSQLRTLSPDALAAAYFGAASAYWSAR
ncbi:MAG TPA: sugar phosphate isomerase/epimerase family protein [Acidothermaceae bacterium]|nr:sugar phosphate isomerase/epimerase family protein [Acidothermaceae bacterium]